MSDYFKVNSSNGSYGVRIGYELLDIKSEKIARQIIICDQLFASTYQALGLKVIGIEASENAKSLDRMGDVIIALRKLGANRTTKILAVGGGVIQDIATFVASVYMRGLKWDYMPTTLLGMVDSCIGGKSSINVGSYKNLIGNFYPPQNIVVDLQFVGTLNTEQKAAGLFEAVKICFAHTNDAFERYLTLHPDTESASEKFHVAIELSLVTKRWFIEIDEYDQKERLLLNFGHTFGHAIEGSCDYSIPHGIAVGLGMLTAIEFAQLNGHFTELPVRVAQLRHYVLGLMTCIKDLSLWAQKIVLSELMDRFCADKKHSDTQYMLIVPNSSGYLVRLALEKNTTNSEMLSQAFRTVCTNAAK
jgi:3-dehydroquinate synthase